MRPLEELWSEACAFAAGMDEEQLYRWFVPLSACKTERETLTDMAARCARRFVDAGLLQSPDGLGEVVCALVDLVLLEKREQDLSYVSAPKVKGPDPKSLLGEARQVHARWYGRPSHNYDLAENDPDFRARKRRAVQQLFAALPKAEGEVLALVKAGYLGTARPAANAGAPLTHAIKKQGEAQQSSGASDLLAAWKPAVDRVLTWIEEARCDHTGFGLIPSDVLRLDQSWRREQDPGGRLPKFLELASRAKEALGEGADAGPATDLIELLQGRNMPSVAELTTAAGRVKKELAWIDSPKRQIEAQASVPVPASLVAANARNRLHEAVIGLAGNLSNVLLLIQRYEQFATGWAVLSHHIKNDGTDAESAPERNAQWRHTLGELRNSLATAQELWNQDVDGPGTRLQLEFDRVSEGEATCGSLYAGTFHGLIMLIVKCVLDPTSIPGYALDEVGAGLSKLETIQELAHRRLIEAMQSRPWWRTFDLGLAREYARVSMSPRPSARARTGQTDNADAEHTIATDQREVSSTHTPPGSADQASKPSPVHSAPGALRVTYRDALSGKPDLGLPPTAKSTLRTWCKNPQAASDLGVNHKGKVSAQQPLVSGLLRLHAQKPTRRVPPQQRKK